MIDQGKTQKNKYKQIFNSQATIYDEAVGNRMIYTSNLLLKEITIPEKPVCLDIACGTGISTNELIKKCNYKGTFYGVDISQGMIETAKKNAKHKGIKATFKQGDAENLEFHDSYFDLITCNMSFHFFPNKEKAISEMYRVLKPGGQAALLFPCKGGNKEATNIFSCVALRHPQFPGFLETVNGFLSRLMSLEEVFRLFQDSDFQVVELFSRRAIRFVDPRVFTEDRPVYQDMWRDGVPSHARKRIGEEMLLEFSKLSEDDEFKVSSLFNIVVIRKQEY